MSKSEDISEIDKVALRKHFPSVRPDPEKGVFEIALVLAGAVSAGAYTAGVMDFLIEALDEWSLQKARDKAAGTNTVPRHEVVLRIITGTSAGGMNGAIAARALNFAFPHVYDERKYAVLVGKLDAKLPAKQKSGDNPFYAAWVDGIDIEPMLNNSDIANRAPMSILNCGRLDAIADAAVNFKGAAVLPGARDWLASPLELRLTNTNLCGVPFDMELAASSAKAHKRYLMHADQLAFAAYLPPTRTPKPEARPDCLELHIEQPTTALEWKTLGAAGLATGAFPIALASRDISRAGAHYKWRDAYYDVNQDEYMMLRPAFPGGIEPETYHYASVDGGVMNNEPFELARRALAGARGHNPQSGMSANRAVIMIDPFVEDPTPGPTGNAGFLKVAARLFPIQIEQARLSAQDLLQVQAGGIYSRFLIAPSGKRDGTPVFGKDALATGGLGAFLGFFCRDYRHHDYVLGRRNAQKFLKSVFTLPQNNSLFGDGRWSDADKLKFGDTNPEAKDHLQIIPVFGSAYDEETEPAWPKGAYRHRRDKIATLIAARVNALGPALGSELARYFATTPKPGAPSLWERVKTWFFNGVGKGIGFVVWRYTSGKLVDEMVNFVDDAVKATDEPYRPPQRAP